LDSEKRFSGRPEKNPSIKIAARNHKPRFGFGASRIAKYVLPSAVLASGLKVNHNFKQYAENELARQNTILRIKQMDAAEDDYRKSLPKLFKAHSVYLEEHEKYHGTFMSHKKHLDDAIQILNEAEKDTTKKKQKWDEF
jgi:hypothetical protein